MKLGERAKDKTIEKLGGARAEEKIRGKAERTRVSTETKAKTQALDIVKARADDKEKEITQTDKASIKAKAKVEAEGIERMMVRSEARENVKAEVNRNGKGEMKTLDISAAG